MAFTGTAVIEQVSDSIVRITGLSLTTTGVGTIGLFGATGSTPGVTLPESFKPEPYTYKGTPVSMAGFISVEVIPVAVVASTSPVVVTKTGTTVADFRAALATSSGSTSAGLEIWVRFHN